MGNLLIEYPKEQKDWLMIEEYARQKHYFGCLYCTKTHTPEQCEHKAKRTSKTSYQEYKTQYSYSGYGD